MSQNKIPVTTKGQIGLAKKMSAGIEKDGASVPITMTSKPLVDAAVADVTSAEAGVTTARATKMDAFIDYIPAAAAVKDFLITTRPIIASNFGNRWSPAWMQVGWIGPSTAVPARDTDRLDLLNAVVNFFAANPSYEVEKSGVTGANAADIYNYAVLTHSGVIDSIQTLEAAESTRVSAKATLLQNMRALIKNLAAKLSPRDTRWLSFGLNKPATQSTPAKPTGVAVGSDSASGDLIFSCDDDPSTERWRWRGRIANSGGNFQLLASTTAPTARIKPMAPGTTWELMVQAVKGGSQSVPSDSIFFTIPLPNAAETAVKTLPAAKQPLQDLMLTDNGIEPMSAMAADGNAKGKAGLAVSRA
ncbi:MAG TPA: hypothetical protein VGG02_05040 [Chthoniobacterales bacterium]|jgi:hypothetical protein